MLSVSSKCLRLVCLLPPAQEQLRVPQMARSSHSDTELEEPTQLAVSSYLATGVKLGPLPSRRCVTP